MELNRNRKRSRFTVHVLRFFAHSKNTHLISDAHTMRSKYHCDSVCSHARSSAYKRNNHMAARRAVRLYSDTDFPPKCALPLHAFVSLCRHVRSLSGPSAPLFSPCGEILTVPIQTTKETNYCIQTAQTPTQSLSPAFTHSQFLDSHKFEHRRTDKGETAKQMISFCCQIACVEIVSILFCHGLKV